MKEEIEEDIEDIKITKTITREFLYNIKQSVEDKTFEMDSNGQFPRKVLIPEKKELFCMDIKTVYELQVFMFNKYKENKYIGHRRMINGNASCYVWETYLDIYEKGEMFAEGLSLIAPKKQECVGFICKGRSELIVSEYACYKRNLVVVHIYQEATSFEIKHIMNETEMQTLFCERNMLTKIAEISHELPHLKNVVLIEDQEQEEDPIKIESVQLYTYRQILDSRPKEGVVFDEHPTPEDVCYLSYTSGTGGMSKGVVIKHKTFVSSFLGVQSVLKNDVIYTDGRGSRRMKQLDDLSAKDIHFSYLPFAHILERLIFMVLSSNGLKIGFWQGDKTKLLDDMQTLRPTFLVAIPRVLNRFCEEIKKKIDQKGGLAKKLFDYAMSVKIDKIEKTGDYSSWFFDYFVFSKIKKYFGGNIRIILSGSAPLSPNVSKFMKTCLSCALFEGYGQTETTGIISITLQSDVVVGHVGVPFPGSCVKLIDVPEMEFTTADKPFPRGEICVKGPNCFDGYYKNEELTKETIQDGWVLTGDIGMWDMEGRLWIIDRKKSIFKLSQGEYVSPEKVETVLCTVPGIEQVFVSGNSIESFIVAIVVPDRQYVEKWKEKNNLKMDYTDLCSSKELKDHFVALMEIKGKKGSGELNGLELPKRVFIEQTPFSVEQNLITMTLKPKRLNIQKKYQKIIDQLYQEY